MATPQHQVPEWETSSSAPAPHRNLFDRSILSSKSPGAHSIEHAQKETSYIEPPIESRHRKLSDRFPPWTSFIGTRRKLLFGGLAVLALLILIIGLAVGLTRNKRYDSNVHVRCRVNYAQVLMGHKTPSSPQSSFLEHWNIDRFARMH